MPLVIIAGVSRSIVWQHAGYEPDIEGWDVAIFPSRSNRNDLRTCWHDILRFTDSSSHGGAHILAFHYAENRRGVFEDSIYGRHRLVWPEKSLLSAYGTAMFSATVKTLVDFERRWRESVRPGDVGSPLILPESSFETQGVLRTTWTRAHDARQTQDQIDRVAKLIDYFRATHYLKGRWIDTGKKTFDHRGPRHALREPKGRRWKYTFEVPEGFHFDVTSERGGKFCLIDAKGANRDFEEHANVDCHGYVRGEK